MKLRLLSSEDSSNEDCRFIPQKFTRSEVAQNSSHGTGLLSNFMAGKERNPGRTPIGGSNGHVRDVYGSTFYTEQNKKQFL